MVVGEKKFFLTKEELAEVNRRMENDRVLSDQEVMEVHDLFKEWRRKAGVCPTKDVPYENIKKYIYNRKYRMNVKSRSIRTSRSPVARQVSPPLARPSVTAHSLQSQPQNVAANAPGSPARRRNLPGPAARPRITRKQSNQLASALNTQGSAPISNASTSNKVASGPSNVPATPDSSATVPTTTPTVDIASQQAPLRTTAAPIAVTCDGDQDMKVAREEEVETLPSLRSRNLTRSRPASPHAQSTQLENSPVKRQKHRIPRTISVKEESGAPKQPKVLKEISGTLNENSQINHIKVPPSNSQPPAPPVPANADKQFRAIHKEEEPIGTGTEPPAPEERAKVFQDLAEKLNQKVEDFDTTVEFKDKMRAIAQLIKDFAELQNMKSYEEIISRFEKQVKLVAPETTEATFIVGNYKNALCVMSSTFCCKQLYTYTHANLLCMGNDSCRIHLGQEYYVKEIGEDEYEEHCKEHFANLKKKESEGFSMAKHYDLAPEKYEVCEKCKTVWHPICRLTRVLMMDNTCKCRKASDQPEINSYVERLPRTNLSEFMEKEVNEIGYKFPKVHIRQVNASSKSQETPETVKKLLYKNRNSLPNFDFKKKKLMAFMEIDGLKTTIFAMIVQEYKEPSVLKDWVAIEYLDSAPVFGPHEIRTAIFQKIVNSYFAHANSRGYKYAHVFACPPLPFEDFILNGKPFKETNLSQTDLQKHLQEWYQKLFVSGNNIISEVKNVDEYLASEGTISPQQLFEKLNVSSFWQDEFKASSSRTARSVKQFKEHVSQLSTKNKDRLYFLSFNTGRTEEAEEEEDFEEECARIENKDISVEVQFNNCWEFKSIRSNHIATRQMTQYLYQKGTDEEATLEDQWTH